MKKVLFAFCVTLGLSFTLLFLPQTQNALVLYTLQQYAHHLSPQGLTFASIEKEPHTIIYHNPQLDLGQGNLIQAESLEIHYEIKWLDLTLAIEAKLIKPLSQISPSILEKKWSEKPLFLPLRLKGHLTTAFGQILLQSPIDFRLDARLDKELEFFLEMKRKGITFQMKSESVNKVISFDFEQFSKEDYGELFQDLAPFIPSPFSFKQKGGLIDGSIDIVMGSTLSLDADLKFDKVEIEVGLNALWSLSQMNGALRILSNQFDSESKLQFELKNVGSFSIGPIIQDLLDTCQVELQGKLDPENATFQITQGNVYDPTRHLALEDLKGQLEWKGVLSVKNAEAYFKGIYFLGTVDIRPINGRSIEIELLPEHIHATLEDFKELVKENANNSPLIDLPFNATLDIYGEENSIRVLIEPLSYQVNAFLMGSLVDGSWKINGVSIDDMSLHFEYSYPKNTLTLKDIQATSLFELKEKSEEINLSGDLIHFPNLNEPLGSFDLWVGDASRDYVRGEGQFAWKKDGSLFLQFVPPHSHFGALSVAHLTMLIKEDGTVDTLQLKGRFELEDLFSEMRAFTPLFENRVPSFDVLVTAFSYARGLIDVEYIYDGEQDLGSLEVKGSHIDLSNHLFKHLSISARFKERNEWLLDTVELDEISLTGELFQTGDHFDIRFLGLSHPRVLKLAMVGKYFPKKRQIEGELQLVDLDLAFLEEVSLFPSLALSQPSGSLHGKGKLKIHFSPHLRSFKIDASLLTSIEDLKISSFSLGSFDALELKFSSEKGISLSHKGWGYELIFESLGNLRLLQEMSPLEQSFKLNWKLAEDKSLEFVTHNSSHLNSLLGPLVASFIPSVGTLEYEIGEGKVILKEMRDVFTENKLFKISLNKEVVSNIRFDGTLNISLNVEPTYPFLKGKVGSLQINGNLRDPVTHFISK